MPARDWALGLPFLAALVAIRFLISLWAVLGCDYEPHRDSEDEDSFNPKRGMTELDTQAVYVGSFFFPFGDSTAQPDCRLDP